MSNAAEKLSSASHAVASLVRRLLDEPFAKENQLRELSLEAIGRLIEDAAEDFSTGSESDPKGLAASYANCKSLYCEILLEFELQNSPPQMTDPISSLLIESDDSSGRGVDVIEVTAPVKEKAQPSTTEKPLAEVKSIQKPTEDVEDREEKTVIGIQIKSMQPATKPQKLGIETLEQYFTSKSAKELFQTALIFSKKSVDRPSKISASELDRLYALYLCLSFEAEVVERVKPQMTGFWPKRESNIRLLMNPEARQFELHPELKREVELKETLHKDWFFDKKFPYLSFMNSLKFIYVTQKSDHFVPTFVDTATLLLFFGHEGSLGKFPLKNLLSVSGVESKELVELTFRLPRVQRVRNCLIGLVEKSPDPTWISTLEKDIRDTAMYFAKIQFGAKKKV